jgi:hypothetical protein
MEERRSNLLPILVALLLLPVIYAAAYFATGTCHELADGEARCRTYATEWLAAGFRPLGKIEQLASGRAVAVATHESFAEFQRQMSAVSYE